MTLFILCSEEKTLGLYVSGFPRKQPEFYTHEAEEKVHLSENKQDSGHSQGFLLASASSLPTSPQLILEHISCLDQRQKRFVWKHKVETSKTCIFSR